MKAAQTLTPPLQEAFVTLAQRMNLNPDLLGWRP